MTTNPRPVDGPWPGHLAIIPRPRGGDWLADEVQSMGRQGVRVLVSLLTPEETDELGLADEAWLSRRQDIKFEWFPIPDRGIPESQGRFSGLVGRIIEHLAAGNDVAVHCRQGVGRAAILAAAVLVSSGLGPAAAIARVAAARGHDVPETPEQRGWLESYARTLPVPVS